MEQVECIVVGAGVVGLAVARRLALLGVEVVVVERADMIGTETSSRNSEVIHAGIYYAKDSLKAELCVEGKHRLYEYCESRRVPHANCGKLIVATDDEEAETLAGIIARGQANGVDDLHMIDGPAVKAMEPEIHAVAAIVSPSTGIIDSHGLMLAYQGEAEDHGAMIAFNTAFLSGEVRPDGFDIAVGDGDDGEYRIGARMLVNSAGLHAPSVGRALAGLAPETVAGQFYCKGSYFSLLGRQPFHRLIYPVPKSASLGVHVSVDLAGRNRFGPDQEWIDEIDYDVDVRRADEFYAAVRSYWPSLPDGALQPAYSGIRPKVQPQGGHSDDYQIQGPESHGTPGLVNLYGIESPGLTSSLAIADRVARALGYQ